MIKKTYIEKSTTIIKDSEYNFGLNPIGELNYGKIVSRALIYFDINDIKNKIADKTYYDISKLKHVLKLTNCASVDPRHINDKIISNINYGFKERAASFDVIVFTVPQKWDAGRGFDYGSKAWVDGRITYSKHGCNWYQSMDGLYWPEEGIYSNSTLSKEYDKYSSNDNSVIVARQHFDFGNENFEIDITDIVNKYAKGEVENNGLCLAFSPLLENTKLDYTQYIGFFNNNTNTFFEPYIETTYNDYVSDDRSKFYLDKQNKLYFYSFIGNNLSNLDNIPTCTINGREYEVKQATKGIYYVDILLESNNVAPNTILYDNWSNISYNGIKFNDVEMEFVTLSPISYFNFGNTILDNKKAIPFLYGINDNEDLVQEDERLIKVEFRVPFSSTKEIVDKAEYRIYTKDGNREIDVIPFMPIEKFYLFNFFKINTKDLLPNKYYVDIKVYENDEIINYKEKLIFNITNKINKLKR